MKRLDKALGNEKWCDLFPNYPLIHLPKTHSDHNPIMIELFPRTRHKHVHPFRLETFWCKHPNFPSLVKSHCIENDYIKSNNSFIDGVKR